MLQNQNIIEKSKSNHQPTQSFDPDAEMIQNVIGQINEDEDKKEEAKLSAEKSDIV